MHVCLGHFPVREVSFFCLTGKLTELCESAIIFEKWEKARRDAVLYFRSTFLPQ